MATSLRRKSPLITLFVVALVAAATLIQNLRPRGPHVAGQFYADDYWETRTTVRGWPLAYYESIDSILLGSRNNLILWPPPIKTVKSPQPDIRNPQSLSLAADICLGLLMLAATAVVAEYWCRHRSGPFQFGLRTLLVATTLVAAIVALLDNNLMHWSVLLSPAIAACIVAVPIVAGLALDAVFRRSERRISQLRSRFDSAE